MWEKAMAMANEEDLAERSEQLARLSEIIADAADQLGLADQSCQRICKDRLEMVDGRLQRVIVCYVVCS